MDRKVGMNVCVCVWLGRKKFRYPPDKKPMPMGYKTLPGIVEVGDTR